MVGAEDGLLRTWRNDGGVFIERTGSDNPFAGIDVGETSAPTFADLDGDGDLDLVVGAFDGTLKVWQNTAPPAAAIEVTVTADVSGP